MKPAITKTKKAAIPAAIERAIARAIAENETQKAAAIAEASRLMKLPCIEEPPYYLAQRRAGGRKEVR